MENEIVSFMIIGAFIAVSSNAVSNTLSHKPFWQGAGQAAIIGAASGAISFGIGTFAKNAIGNVYLRAAFQAGAHGTWGGVSTYIQGGNFIHGFTSGVVSSSLSSLGGEVLKIGPTGMIVVGGISGGLGAELTGGNFWQGFSQGLIVSALNHAAHSAANSEQGGDPPSNMAQIAAEAEAMRSRWDALLSGGILALDTGNNGMGGMGAGMGQVGGSLRFTNGAYNGSKFSLRHYASGWNGGSVARITTYNLKAYGSILGKYSALGTGILGAYNIGTGFYKDGYSFGYNTQLATAQTVGGIAGAYAFGKLGALGGAYFGPWGSLIGGIGGAAYGGIQGTSTSTDIFNFFKSK